VDLELRGRKVLITGASKGIGLACAHGFAAEGARVHIAARSEAGLKAAGDAIAREHKAELSVHPFDLGKTRNIVALAQACGDVDILVNNAGAIPSGSLTEIDDETMRRGGRKYRRRSRRRPRSGAPASRRRWRTWSSFSPRPGPLTSAGRYSPSRGTVSKPSSSGNRYPSG
jgi:hypothetical protein